MTFRKYCTFNKIYEDYQNMKKKNYITFFFLMNFKITLKSNMSIIKTIWHQCSTNHDKLIGNIPLMSNKR